MAKYLINDTTLNDIACAIRSKCGKNDPIKVCEFADEIETIKAGEEPTLIEKEITANGTYAPSNDGADGYSSINVNVPIPEGYIKPEGSLSITENGTYPVADKEEVVVSVTTPNPTPTEISTEAEMTALLSSSNIGSVYKFTGTSETYETGALYLLEEVSE